MDGRCLTASWWKSLGIVLLVADAAACSRDEKPPDPERNEPRAAVAGDTGVRPSEALHPAQRAPEHGKLIERLRSPDGKVVAAALAASGPLLAEAFPDRRLVAEIVQLAEQHEDAALRHAVVEILGRLDPGHRDAPVLEVLESSLASSEAHVLSATLHALRPCNGSPPSAAIRLRLLELAEHEDPGVRGQALRLLGECSSRTVAPWPPEGTGWGPPHLTVCTSPRPDVLPIGLRQASLARAWAALDDQHPYVRAVASEALARMGYVQAIHPLMGLIEDSQPGTYLLDGWVRLDGTPGRIRHELPGLSSVGESAMAAIQILSAGQLDPKQVGSQGPAGSLEGRAPFLRTWYTKHARDRVPVGSPGPVFPADARYRRTPPSGLH